MARVERWTAGPLFGVSSGWALAAAAIVAFDGRAGGPEKLIDGLWLSGLGLLPSFLLLHLPLSVVSRRFACASSGWLVAGVGFLLALPAAFLVALVYNDDSQVLRVLRYHVTTFGGVLWLLAYGCAGAVFSLSLRARAPEAG